MKYFCATLVDPAVIRVGTSGFPKTQEETFACLDLLEVQKTFYQPPQLRTVRRWRARAPQGFRFTVKAWQLITHEATSPTYRRLREDIQGKEDRYGQFRPTEKVFGAWAATRAACEALEADVVVFQSPPSFTEDEEAVGNFRAFFREADLPCPAAWEPRGGWSRETVARLCDDLGLIHCVDPFADEAVPQDVAYYRLDGFPPGNRRYYYTYTDEDLAHLRDRCDGYRDAFVLFNNVSMFEDALRFREAARV